MADKKKKVRTFSSDRSKGQERPLSDNQFIEGIKNGDQTILSKAITLIESTKKQDEVLSDEILNGCLKLSGNSIRIGITGVPGVGKSTFIEKLGLLLIKKGHKVAVLTVDPSSSVSKGSILGDKTRMPELLKSDNAFIRPTPTNNNLGGVAHKTRESIILCEAAGFDVVLVETVGVGQSETTVHGMVDFFLLLKLAGAGDDLQGIKRGIIELADVIAINKADGTNLEIAKQEASIFKRALALFPPKQNGWDPQVTYCSALHDEGIQELWSLIDEFIIKTKKNATFHKKREEQLQNWMLEIVEQTLKKNFYINQKVKSLQDQLLKKVLSKTISPKQAADMLLRSFDIKP